MIDKKIFREIGEILDELVKQAGSHYNGWEPKEGWMTSPMAYEKIKSLLKEYAMEIIGEMEEENLPSPFSRARNIGAEYRNQLRSEQREKLLTEDK